MNVKDLPSPNHDSRDGHMIDMLVLHYTGMKTMEAARARLCDPESKVSAHYLIDEDGAAYALVPESERAWHAGVSHWRGHTNINQRSIGIEIVNPGHEFGYRPFPDAQMQAVAALCKDILARHPIPPRNVVAHSDVAPQRKDDPGELFDWKWLAAQGIGIWPQLAAGRWQMATDCQMSDASCQLRDYGYDTTDLPKALLAFQRHFFPTRLGGAWDLECALGLQSLLDSAL